MYYQLPYKYFNTHGVLLTIEGIITHKLMY